MKELRNIETYVDMLKTLGPHGSFNNDLLKLYDVP